MIKIVNVEVICFKILRHKKQTLEFQKKHDQHMKKEGPYSFLHAFNAERKDT